MQLLRKLCETPAVPGREQKLIDLMKAELEKSCDSVSIDALGNVIGFRKSGSRRAKKVMLCAHMDEIGFVVSHIDDKGFIRVAPRGYHYPRTLLAQRVRIMGKRELVGVVEAAPALGADAKDRDQAPAVKDMFVDTGMGADELKKIVETGDIVVLERSFVEQGDILMSKAFDDRVGCYLLIETMKRLAKKKLPVDLYAVGSTQEEVGLRGARGAAKSLLPDIGIALDVTCASDVPGVAEPAHVTGLGKGVAIKINDVASISNHGIVRHLTALARKYRIRHQMEILPSGGTDAGAMQVFGAGPVCTISIPTRYVHSPSEMISKKDLKAGIDLAVKFVETADRCRLEF